MIFPFCLFVVLFFLILPSVVTFSWVLSCDVLYSFVPLYPYVILSSLLFLLFSYRTLLHTLLTSLPPPTFPHPSCHPSPLLHPFSPPSFLSPPDSSSDLRPSKRCHRASGDQQCVRHMLDRKPSHEVSILTILTYFLACLLASLFACLHAYLLWYVLSCFPTCLLS